MATFYAHFDVVKEGETPPPPVTVRVCDSLSCALLGAERLLAELPKKLGTNVRVVRAPCMGACDRAPVCAVGHVQVMHADAAKVAAAAAKPAHAHTYPTPVPFAAYAKAGGYELLKACLSRQAHARRSHQDRQRCRTARLGRRRVSDRPQMVVGARRAGAAPVRGELRRGRAGHVQGPLLSRAGSAPLHRRHADRSLDRRSCRHLSLCPRRISRNDPSPGRRDRQSRGSGTIQPHQNPSAPRRRRLHLRRRIRDDRIDRGQARPAAPSAALCRAGRIVRPPDARAERRDAVLGPRHRREGRRLVHLAGPPRAQRVSAASRFPAASRIPASSSRPPASPRAN